ncbi:TonB-system energizer ExbB type-1 [Parvibaculum lavamentivorans DS-1]|uniref:Biopolymer transport protein ExbB n=1 Tax=Parvibaculum lavamentivorans (strain DS-1 / DSM 13023 / NCIMB 13966) TaxID=402881 RepID=A7HQ15_PARL1|nr:tonB-system energizer ExbB [Parvibaculum lavamentivorans]ABS61998.1 TonB-system energizer ExbB type-1 [Parvibaculum lavamentivorans DS-1]
MTNGPAGKLRATFFHFSLAALLSAFVLASPLHAQEAPAGDGFGQEESLTPLDGAATEDAIGISEDLTAEELAAMGETEALPDDLSPWGMFLAADIVVKAVMIGLVFASIVTWTIWLAKNTEIARARSRAKSGFAALAASKTLDEAGEKLRSAKGPVQQLAQAAIHEMQLSGTAPDKEGVKERIAWRFQRIEANTAREIGIGTGVLATIGATAPFVGLFGTVWGIMNSFIGIAHTQTTNLAVVAPGIAEALLATGLGLVAAIPAVVIYNSFSRAIAGYRAIVADSSAELLRLVSRDLDHGREQRLAKAAD